MPDTVTEARYCEACGYWLRALQVNRCSECGHDFDPLDPSTTARSSQVVLRRQAVRKARVFALSVALLYVLSYLALVRPTAQGFRSGPPFPFLLPKHAIYAIDNPLIERFFSPINTLDRRVRTKTWDDFGVSPECLEAAKLCDRTYSFLLSRLPGEARKDEQVRRLWAALKDIDNAISLADTCAPASSARKDALALVHRLQATLELALRDVEAHYRR